MPRSGGFQGRGNKLVDACYSFWQGSTPAVLSVATHGQYSAATEAEGEDDTTAEAKPGTAATGALLFDQERLQEYILKCCQYIKGGLRDKPGKGRDYYHTCYALPGLSLAQTGQCNIGSETNILRQTDPIFNVRVDRLAFAKEYFSNFACSHDTLMESSPTDVEI